MSDQATFLRMKQLASSSTSKRTEQADQQSIRRPPSGTEEWYRQVCRSPIRALPTYEELEASTEIIVTLSASGSSFQQQKQTQKESIQEGYQEPLPFELSGEKRDFWGLKRHFEAERLRTQRHTEQREEIFWFPGHRGRHYGVPLQNEFPPSREFQANARRNSCVLDDDEDKGFRTVKCVCGGSKDGGRMVFCFGCDTLRHVECTCARETGWERAFGHHCADCKPKLLEKVESERREMVGSEGWDVIDH